MEKCGNISSDSRKSSNTNDAAVSSASSDQEVYEDRASSSAESSQPRPCLAPLQSQPTPKTGDAATPNATLSSKDICQSVTHTRASLEMNVIPEFDPSMEDSDVDIWLDKVNECAKIHNWDEDCIIYSALSKLAGNAKKWYQEQLTAVHTWARWQKLLRYAFPYQSNYCRVVADMLDRRFREDNDVEEYYYDKMALLYACDISGERAVDCVIHGIDCACTRQILMEAGYKEPGALFTFLKDFADEEWVTKRGPSV